MVTKRIKDGELDAHVLMIDRKRERRSIKQATLAARLIELYPSFPDDPQAITCRSVQKSRIGTSGTVALDRTVNIIVKAHARHVYTNYNQYLADGMSKIEARKLIRKQVEKLVHEWKTPGVKASYSVSTQIQSAQLMPLSVDTKNMSVLQLQVESKTILEFRTNGDIFWNGRLITSDLDLVAGLTEIVASYRKDSEYRRKLTVIQNIHET